MISFNQISQSLALIVNVIIFVITFSDQQVNFVKMMLFYEVFESVFTLILLSPFITDHNLFKIVLFIDVG